MAEKGNKVPPRCVYCRNSHVMYSKQVVCLKEGHVKPDGQCKRFQCDEVKRKAYMAEVKEPQTGKEKEASKVPLEQKAFAGEKRPIAPQAHGKENQAVAKKDFPRESKGLAPEIKKKEKDRIPRKNKSPKGKGLVVVLLVLVLLLGLAAGGAFYVWNGYKKYESDHAAMVVTVKEETAAGTQILIDNEVLDQVLQATGLSGSMSSEDLEHALTVNKRAAISEQENSVYDFTLVLPAGTGKRVSAENILTILGETLKNKMNGSDLVVPAILNIDFTDEVNGLAATEAVGRLQLKAEEIQRYLQEKSYAMPEYRSEATGLSFDEAAKEFHEILNQAVLSGDSLTDTTEKYEELMEEYNAVSDEYDAWSFALEQYDEELAKAALDLAKADEKDYETQSEQSLSTMTDKVQAASDRMMEIQKELDQIEAQWSLSTEDAKEEKESGDTVISSLVDQLQNALEQAVAMNQEYLAVQTQDSVMCVIAPSIDMGSYVRNLFVKEPVSQEVPELEEKVQSANSTESLSIERYVANNSQNGEMLVGELEDYTLRLISYLRSTKEFRSSKNGYSYQDIKDECQYILDMELAPLMSSAKGGSEDVLDASVYEEQFQQLDSQIEEARQKEDVAWNNLQEYAKNVKAGKLFVQSVSYDELLMEYVNYRIERNNLQRTKEKLENKRDIENVEVTDVPININDRTARVQRELGQIYDILLQIEEEYQNTENYTEG